MTPFREDDWFERADQLRSWFERADQLRSGAIGLDAMAADDTLPINAAARDVLRGVATILRSEAKRITRMERVTP